MKIYINREPVSGPWGGGNKSLVALIDRIRSEGSEVVFNLDSDDIDTIFCFDPRPNSKGVWYQNFLDYREKNKNVKIVQRVGDIGTHSKPELTQLILQTTRLSDFCIFPSRWARDAIQFKGPNCAIVKNRPTPAFYNHRDDAVLESSDRVRLVTHHWSTNPKKGFEIYRGLSQHCKERESLEFSYIGRLPEGFDKNMFSEYIEPKDESFLSEALPTYDIYITASIEEAGANHPIEAIAAGLPVIYHELGGSIPEYCDEYGIQYNDLGSLLRSIDLMIEMYPFYKRRVLNYNRTNLEISEDYWRIICGIN